MAVWPCPECDEQGCPACLYSGSVDDGNPYGREAEHADS